MLTARFASKSVEAEFQRTVAYRNTRQNVFGLAFLSVVLVLFSVSELLSLEEPGPAVALRLLAGAVGGLALLGFLSPALRARQELITLLVCFFGTGALLAIIGSQETFEDTHYVAYIQGCILFAFILRLSFTNLVILYAVGLFGFGLAVARVAPVETATVKCASIFVTMSICATGIYFIERYQRRDFIQARIIERQNAKLSAMLAELQRDNAQKIATLNLLVHFVRTPIHQISGFAEVLATMEPSDDASPNAEYLDYIKSAARDLNLNVTQLLEYHRLDDGVESEPNAVIDLAEAFDEALDRHNEYDAVARGFEQDAVGAMRGDTVRRALDGLSRRAAAAVAAGAAVRASVGEREGRLYARLNVVGDDLSAEDFAHQTIPLVEVTNYLNADRSAISMDLRTAGRAAELLGGALTRVDVENGYAIELAVPKRDPAESEPIAAETSDDDEPVADASPRDAA